MTIDQNTKIANSIKNKRRMLLSSQPTSTSKEHVQRRLESFQSLFNASEAEVILHLLSFVTEAPRSLSVALANGWKLKEIKSHKEFDLTDPNQLKEYITLSNWEFRPTATKLKQQQKEEEIEKIGEAYLFYRPERGWNYKLSDFLRMALDQAKAWNYEFPLSKTDFYDCLRFVCHEMENDNIELEQRVFLEITFGELPTGVPDIDRTVPRIKWNQIYRNMKCYPGKLRDGEYTLDENNRFNNPEMFEIRPELYGQSEALDQQLHLAQELRDLGLSFKLIAVEMSTTEYKVRSWFG